jgi:glyoxylase I family protein
MVDFSFPSKNINSTLADWGHAHVCLRVPDYRSSKQWWGDRLDFRTVIEWELGDMQLGYLSPPADDFAIVELIGNGADAPPVLPTPTDLQLTRSGYHHYCFTVRSVEASIAELKRRGVTIVREPFILDAISRRLAFFSDPDGHLFELSETLH